MQAMDVAAQTGLPLNTLHPTVNTNRNVPTNSATWETGIVQQPVRCAPMVSLVVWVMRLHRFIADSVGMWQAHHGPTRRRRVHPGVCQSMAKMPGSHETRPRCCLGTLETPAQPSLCLLSSTELRALMPTSPSRHLVSADKLVLSIYNPRTRLSTSQVVVLCMTRATGCFYAGQASG